MSLSSTRLTNASKTEGILIHIYMLEDDEDSYELSLNYYPEKRWSLILSFKDENGDLVEEITFSFKENNFEVDENDIYTIRHTIVKYINSLDPHHIVIIYKGAGKDPIKRDVEDYGSVLYRSKQRDVQFETNYEDDEDHLEIYNQLRTLGDILTMEKRLGFFFYTKAMVRHMIQNEIEEIVKDKECPVLLEPLKAGKACMLPCNHFLSQEAFANIKKIEGHPKCPCCRELFCLGNVKNL
jgi:hypothetical protein